MKKVVMQVSKKGWDAIQSNPSMCLNENLEAREVKQFD